MTTAGGIEEDLIKCLGPVYVGSFTMSGKELYDKGLNRSEKKKSLIASLDFPLLSVSRVILN